LSCSLAPIAFGAMCAAVMASVVDFNVLVVESHRVLSTRPEPEKDACRDRAVSFCTPNTSSDCVGAATPMPRFLLVVKPVQVGRRDTASSRCRPRLCYCGKCRRPCPLRASKRSCRDFAGIHRRYLGAGGLHPLCWDGCCIGPKLARADRVWRYVCRRDGVTGGKARDVQRPGSSVASSAVSLAPEPEDETVILPAVMFSALDTCGLLATQRGAHVGIARDAGCATTALPTSIDDCLRLRLSPENLRSRAGGEQRHIVSYCQVDLFGAWPRRDWC
jgi:hypothetical protein